MKTDLFQSCGHCWVFQICWHIECSTFTASSFRIWNSSTGMPSPPLALFVVMLSKAHLKTHHTIMIILVMKIFFVQFLCVFLPPLLNIFCFCWLVPKYYFLFLDSSKCSFRSFMRCYRKPEQTFWPTQYDSPMKGTKALQRIYKWGRKYARWAWSICSIRKQVIHTHTYTHEHTNRNMSKGYSRQDYWSGCHFFLQGIFQTQDSNLGLLHCRQSLYQLSYKGSPKIGP